MAGQQAAAKPQRGKETAGALQVLAGQDLGGGHQRCLKAGQMGQVQRPEGDGRLAAAHVPLHKAGHGGILPKVRCDLVQHPFLRGGRREGKGSPETRRPLRREGEGGGLLLFAPQAVHGGLIQKQVLKVEPAAREGQGLFVFGAVGSADGVRSAHEAVAEEGFPGQGLGTQGRDSLKRLPHEARVGFPGNALDGPVLGDQRPFLFDGGRHQHGPSLINAHPPVQKHRPFRGQQVLDPGLVEPPGLEDACFVRHGG